MILDFFPILRYFYVFVKKRKRKMKNQILRLRFFYFTENVKNYQRHKKNVTVKYVKKT